MTTGSTFVLAYVDDLIIIGDAIADISYLQAQLAKSFQIKDLGPLQYFLRVEVSRSANGIFLSQWKYALDILTDMGMMGCHPSPSPMEQHLKLNFPDGELLSDPAPYLRLIGRLLYLTFTRPDLSYSVQVLSQFMQYPRSPHLDAAMRVLRYLKQSPGQGIFLSARSSIQLCAFSDSDWTGCPITRCSTSGYCMLLGASPISWQSKKQSTVSRSSVESEYHAMAQASCEIQWITYLLADLGYPEINSGHS
ncbi:uncharacterized mitochondrial protein AtMg00810-like [Macadamia integrifolia]|uniref:uncharacterized mitochondrial protein AtMg00810-like n=1 Tax=Macadamia integrifolia TaxID=60698 RepID=UPI001C4FF606|nr:uncharacterized mitochondrial protein AtMg00810-like [Macadamia integrifolia]XP_042501423.1 uncharacterized mitochondrial protein AtMg00810-like [Macadamia integrifolia]XP_042501424.1 uncharacterized mitochondrial protein AtMg00810-like [Macadamia integrifolia]